MFDSDRNSAGSVRGRVQRANHAAIERPGTLRVTWMQAANLDTPLSSLFRITLRCGGCGRVTSLRTITKLLRVTAGQIGIAIGLLRRSSFHRTIRPLREVTVDPACIP